MGEINEELVKLINALKMAFSELPDTDDGYNEYADLIISSADAIKTIRKNK